MISLFSFSPSCRIIIKKKYDILTVRMNVERYIFKDRSVIGLALTLLKAEHLC